MAARTGQEYVEALDERAIQVEIEGERFTGNVSHDPSAPERRRGPTRSSSTSSTTPTFAT